MVTNSPVRIHFYNTTILTSPENLTNRKILLLPPLGIKKQELSQTFTQELYSSIQSHFKSPVAFISTDSVYAPYIAESNLILNDGTINVKEIALIGSLMGCTYIVCPQVKNINPYFPQRIDMQITIIHTKSSETVAELVGAFDARDSQVATYFERYNKENLTSKKDADALAYKLKSPTTFQSFVTDTCSELIHRKLAF
jgi:hypothetical protein